MQQTIGPDCDLCEGLVGEVQSRVPNGGRLEGGGFVVTSAESPGIEPNGVAVVTVFYDENAGRLLDADGDVVEEYEAAKDTRSDVYLVREGDSWKVDNATLGSPFATESPES